MHSRRNCRVLQPSTCPSYFIQASDIRGKGAVACARLAALLVFSLLMAIATPAFAATESVVYSFANPPDAFKPQCNLVADTAGNMYGTTFSGGANNLGAIFKITSTGTESVVYSFAGGADGSHPVAGLALNKKTGVLYGTTVFGGTTNNGTVFSLNPATGSEKVLYSFLGGTDGVNPYSSVVLAGTNVYGTTFSGGAFGYGTVFKVTAAGKETILHNFNSAFPTLDGSNPYGGMVVRKGVLYGTTTMGGAQNLGTVFSITKTGGYTLLYSFKGGSGDGQNPFGGVAFDSLGNIYGTTYDGGVDNAGVVYTLPLGGGADAVLHHFRRDGLDGINPYASLILFKGNFYGTTTGGNADGGTVFKITPAGTETVLHRFTGGTTDGFNPYSALVLGIDKALYSTTNIGGASSLGTVFKLIP